VVSPSIVRVIPGDETNFDCAGTRLIDNVEARVREPACAASLCPVLHLPGEARSIDVDRHVARRHTASDVPLLCALMRQLATVRPDSDSRLPHIEQLALDGLVSIYWRSVSAGR
jgi:hypothetical protein